MKLYHKLAEYYYSIENKHRDITDDISLIKDLIKDKKESSILDLGCGTGEHIALLHDLGFNCVGIDNSHDMLEVAQRRFPDSGDFIEGDIISFDYFEEFDMVISLFGSLNYLIDDEELDKVLWNTWRALKPKGIGLFEIWNSIPVKKIMEKSLSHVSTTNYNGIIIDRERGFKLLNHTDRTVVEVNYKYTIKKDESSEIVTDKHVMRAFEKKEIEQLLLSNGFKIQNVYSNSLMEPLRETSNRIFIHFIKV
jgi:SAM-dependent methyltransferase